MGIFDPWMQRPQGGLLDIDPVMLAIAGQLLDNAGPSPVKRNPMQGIPQAIMAGQQSATQREMSRAQIEDLRAKRDATSRQNAARTQFGAMMQPTFHRGVLSDDEGNDMPWARQNPDMKDPGLMASFLDAYPEQGGGLLGKMMMPDEPPPETWQSPMEVTGPDGKPALIHSSNRGNVRQVPGFGPKPAATREPPEIVQLLNSLEAAPADQKPAIEARIRAITKADMTPVELDMVVKSYDAYQSAGGAIGALTDALQFNEKAYEGVFAKAAQEGARLAGMDEEGIVATTQFNSIMLGQVVSSLRNSFGGSPSEGERKILEEITASVSLSRAERKAVIERGIRLAQERQAAEGRKMEQIQTGAFRSGTVTLPTTPGAARTAPEGATLFGFDPQDGQPVYQLPDGRKIKLGR